LETVGDPCRLHSPWPNPQLAAFFLKGNPPRQSKPVFAEHGAHPAKNARVGTHSRCELKDGRLEAKHQTGGDADVLLIRLPSGKEHEPVRLRQTQCEVFSGIDIQATAERHGKGIPRLSSVAHTGSPKKSMDKRCYSAGAGREGWTDHVRVHVSPFL
jgi:hypothetical protein